ncbi:cell shape determination protein CcmA [Gordoniibacillus kamchatkensis]|uniref:Cell shape determination protein CcmA n=1 Tax=Gordoniibacillus kamchatkensis TaxID=1590651 RepID=A0ABR5AEI3_9BACL|nr:polymer-forming cytoskeletal protein [Paenibacillus sp. VKM B-2647]KIL39465.1 cell shape determination protein CcmA [Paenibacillus sp. VKM B-2647]
MMGSKKKHDFSATDTVIGEGTLCEGKIVSDASIRVEGHLEGDIECGGDITVGENADVHASITARDVIIAGKVRGNVTCKGKLTVLASGQLFGNIDARSFVIVEGGIFQGTSLMKPLAPAAEPVHNNNKVIDAKAHKQNKEAAAAAGHG